jgi:hypothetical protein
MVLSPDREPEHKKPETQAQYGFEGVRKLHSLLQASTHQETKEI